jgi:hypothetical protein
MIWAFHFASVKLGLEQILISGKVDKKKSQIGRLVIMDYDLPVQFYVFSWIPVSD